MAKGRVKPPGRPCSLLQLCNINHLPVPLGRSPGALTPLEKLVSALQEVLFPSFLPWTVPHTLWDIGWQRFPTRAWWCCPAHGFLAVGGRPSKCFLGSQRKDSAGFPSPPTIKTHVDIARNVIPGVGKRGHFEKPFESLLSHLFSSWEGSVSRT